MVCNETIRRRVLKFGPWRATLSAGAQHRTITGKSMRWSSRSRAAHVHCMWRAVASEGEMLEVLVQLHRDEAAAVKLLRKSLKAAGLRADRHCH
jgi:transposase-like protein